MRFTKLTATLFATTIMASMLVMPEPTHGMMTGVNRAQAKATKQMDAMEHTAEAFNGGAPVLGNALLSALNAAANDAQSVAHLGHDTANIAERIEVLRKVQTAMGTKRMSARDKDVHYPALGAALGVDHLPPEQAKEFIIGLVNKAQNELVRLPRAAERLKAKAYTLYLAERDLRKKDGTLQEREEHKQAVKKKLQDGVDLVGIVPARTVHYPAIPADVSEEALLKAIVQVVRHSIEESLLEAAQPILDAAAAPGADALAKAKGRIAEDIMAKMVSDGAVSDWLRDEFDID